MTDQDEPVAFFVTDEDWYVSRHNVNCVLCYKERCMAVSSTQQRVQGSGSLVCTGCPINAPFPFSSVLLTFKGSMSSGWLLLNF